MALGTWTQRTSSFGTSSIFSVAYGNGVWVAGGFNGKLATATDPTDNWTQRTSSFGTTDSIRGVAYDGTTWVAVGDVGKLATATDPTATWTQRTSSFGSSDINSVAYGNGVWVAVGASGKLATATDPTANDNWTQRTSSFSTSTILSVAYGNGVWVAGGFNGKLATATDPTDNWTQRTSSFGTDSIRGVAYDGTTWVAVGDVGKLATATDPTGTWTQRTSSFGTSSIFSVAYGNGVWVAGGFNGKLATATDPTDNWTQRTSSFGTDTIVSVAYGNGVWVAVGASGKLATARELAGLSQSTLLASADVSIGSWVKETGSGTPIFGEVDEGIAGADNTGVKFTGSGNPSTLIFALSDTPSDLGSGSVLDVEMTLRHKQSGRSDDTMTWAARVLDSASVILAAADSGGTNQNVDGDDPYRTSYANNVPVGWSYVKTDATKAQWEDARVSFACTKSSVKGADTVTWFIDTFDIVVTYTPTAAGGAPVDPMGMSGFFGA